MARTQVQSELIATNSISGTIIADGAITSTHLAANSVDTAELVTGSIDTIHIAANQVTSAKIASNSILTRHIQNDQIGGDQLTNNIDIAGTLDVTGATTLDSTLGVAGIATITNAADTDGLLVTSPASSGGTGIQLKRLDSNTDQQVGRILFGNNTDTDLVSVSAKTDGANDNGALMFSTQPDSGALTERMRIDHNGKVGMGATSPSKNLHIKSGVSEDTGIIIENTNNAQNLDIDYWNNAGAVQGRLRYAEGAGSFSFFPNTSATEALTILYDGKVGIGEASPDAPLHITSNTPIIVFDESDASQEYRIGSFGGAFALDDSTDSAYRLAVDGDGNVGIGTTSPAKPLHISSADNQPLRLESTDAYTGIELKDNGSATLPPLISALSDDFIFYGGHGSTRPEIFRATAAGDVGIGQTPIANSRLTVKTQGDGTYPIRVVNSADTDMLFGVYESSDGDGNNGMLYLNDGGGTTDVKLSTNGDSWFNGGSVAIGADHADAPLTVRRSGLNVDTICIELGNDLHATNTKDAWIRYVGGAATTDHSWATGILSNSYRVVQLGARGTAPSSGTETMRITDGGLMCVGDTTGYPGGHDAVSRLQLTGGGSVLGIRQSQVTDSSHRVVAVFTDAGGTYRGRITVNNSSCSFTAASDYRLKENIETLPNGLDRLKQLKPVKFKWKEHNYTSEGFIAHEVQEIYPDAVVGEKDDKVMQSMDYGKITPLLVKAIQEQQTIIDDLKARIETLEG